MWYKHMQTAISINSCYRRAVQHCARWIYCARGVRGGHQNEGEMGQQIHRQVLSQTGRTRANVTRLLFSGDVVSEWISITQQSKRSAAVFCGFEHEDVKAQSAHKVLCFAFLLCDEDSSHRSISAPWFGNGYTDKFCKSKMMLLTKNKNFRSLLIFVPFTWFQDPSFILYWFYPVTNRDEWRICNKFCKYASFFSS